MVTKGRMAAWAIASVIPLAVVAFGILLFINGVLLTRDFIIAVFVVPAIAILLLADSIFSKKGGGVIRTISALCSLLLFLLALMFVVGFGTFELFRTHTGVEIGERYNEVCDNFDSMPTLAEVGDYDSAVHHEFLSQIAIFGVEADTLICQYSEEEYARQVSALNERYEFQSESMSACEYTVEPSVEIDGYEFRFVAIDRENDPDRLEYPKKMILIATNDTTYEIAYTAFYDDDIDFIYSIEEFILNDCGWKHIIK